MIAFLLIRELPGEFNDLLRSGPENTTTTVDHLVPLWGLPLLCPATHLLPQLFVFSVQKLDGVAKLRTVREAPSECICPPGK